MTDRLSALRYLAVVATTLLCLTASNGTLATELFQGPNTVADDLKPGGEGFADPLTDPKFRAGLFEGEFQPWFDFKDSLKQNYNLDLGLDYTALGQFTNSDLGEGNAASHIARFYGTWTPINPGGVNSGSMNFKIENRLAYTSIAPADLGFDAGAVSVTGYAFSDAGSILTNLYWQQGLLDDRVKIVFGQIDVTDFFDQYPFTSSSTTFLNSAFSGSPAIATPSQGLGAGLGMWLTDQFYALAGIADANADPANPDFLVFDTGETFQSVEFGFTSSRDRIFLDNIHLTLWSVDERKEAGISSD